MVRNYYVRRDVDRVKESPRAGVQTSCPFQYNIFAIFDLRTLSRYLPAPVDAWDFCIAKEDTHLKDGLHLNRKGSGVFFRLLMNSYNGIIAMRCY